MKTPFSIKPSWLWLLAAHCLLWTVLEWMRLPSLDGFGDMIENYAWGQTWEWGNFKHPPLFSWVVKLWFMVFPTTSFFYYVLSYANVAAAVLGVLRLAHLFFYRAGNFSTQPQVYNNFMLLVLVFALLGTPFSHLAAKFNANTILLSLWPWTAYAFFALMFAQTPHQKWRYTGLLAVLAAAAMLGKYYSALLLLSLFVVSVVEKDFRRFYRMPYLYVTLVLTTLLLFPHIMWEIRMDFPFKAYVEHVHGHAFTWQKTASFILTGVYFMALSWLLWALMRWKYCRQPPINATMRLRPLVLVSLLPALLTVAFFYFASVYPIIHWAMPIWFAVPIILAASCQAALAHINANKLIKTLLLIWLIILIGNGVQVYQSAKNGSPTHALARDVMVNTISQTFARRYPGQTLAWASGTWPEAAALSFFMPEHPRGLPYTPDSPAAQITPYPNWQQHYGVMMCFHYHSDGAAGVFEQDCMAQTEAWLQAQHKPIIKDVLTYHASGWLFIKPVPKQVVVYWVPPQK